MGVTFTNKDAGAANNDQCSPYVFTLVIMSFHDVGARRSGNGLGRSVETQLASKTVYRLTLRALALHRDVFVSSL